MQTLSNNWDLFCSKLDQVKPTKNGIRALCPSHDDKHPSLTATYKEGIILVKCQAGCTFEEIVSDLGMEQSKFFAKEKTKSYKSGEVARYRYEDKEGKHAFDVVRLKPKTFRPQRPDGKWTSEGVERVPYRLPQLLEGNKLGREIFILEGEKDCDNAEKFGLVATTFSGGAGKWHKEYSKWFQEAKVICLPDNDDAGRIGMHNIASEIAKIAESVRWLDLPDIPEKGDLSDWLKLEGNDFEKFKALVTGSSIQWTSSLDDHDESLDPEDFNVKLLEELNQKYAIVPAGNKTLILGESEEEIRFLTPSDFNLALENKFAFDISGKYPKEIPAYTWWRRHPDRREYKKVDFLPKIETPERVFNMWRGFAVKPKGGMDDIPLFHELIDEVICSGNERWSIYLWGWLGHMVKFPREKPGVAVVLRSDAQGVGKSRFVEYVGSILGRHFRTVTQGRHIHGYFNSHLKDTLLLFGDEAVWGGDKSTESILKQYITEPKVIIEMKGIDVFEVKSYMRLMLATNSEWAAPVSLTDRRYFVLDVSDEKRNDFDFFRQLQYEQDNGGREALLQALMDVDLSDFEVRSIPETPARLEQKFLSMGLIEKWWIAVLSDENFLIGGKIFESNVNNRKSKQDLLDSFNEYTKEHKPNHRNWESRRFCCQFKKLVSFTLDKRRGSGPREFEFPSTNECKIYFAEKYSLNIEFFDFI